MDLDVPFIIAYTVGGTTNFYSNLAVLAIITWQILLVCVPMVYIAIRLQVTNKFFFEKYCDTKMVSSILISIEKAIKFN